MKKPDVDLGDVKDVVETAGEKISDVAKDSAGALKDNAADLAGGVKARIDGWLPGGPEAPADLPALSDQAKLLYCRILAKQARTDRSLDPREISNLYFFASTIGLDAESRTALRREMTAERPEGDEAADVDDGGDALALAKQLADLLDEPQRQAVLTILVKDLLWMSRADARVADEERGRITAIAALVFPDTADKAVQETERLLVAEEEFAIGKTDASQLELRTKDIIAKAAALGAPLAAVSLAGSGSGAVALTTGLATLGFGGVLGFSAMVTGIGTVVVIGVVVYQGTRFALGINERERQEHHEFVVQEVIKNHQKAIADLAEDIADLARRMRDYLTLSSRSERRLAMLKTELASFQLALADLQIKEELAQTQAAIRG
jgi:hypothetical protein